MRLPDSCADALRSRSRCCRRARSGRDQTEEGRTSVGDRIGMHLANGLEFKVVDVIASDDEFLPLKERIEVVADEV